MKKLFVPYELALKLKEKGFDEECLAEYVNGFLLNNQQNAVEYENKDSDWNTYTNSYTNWTITKTRKVCSAPLWQQAIEWLNKIGFERHINIYLIYDGFISNTEKELISEIEKALEIL